MDGPHFEAPDQAASSGWWKPSYRVHCGERLADTDLVCGETLTRHFTLARHMRKFHQTHDPTAIFYVKGKVDGLNDSIISYLHTITTRAETNQSEVYMHESEDVRDFWTVVMGTCLPDSMPGQVPADYESNEGCSPSDPTVVNETCHHGKPQVKLRELIAEAILSSPSQQMSFEEITEFIGAHYPWYVQPFGRSTFALVCRGPSTRRGGG